MTIWLNQSHKLKLQCSQAKTQLKNVELQRKLR